MTKKRIRKSLLGVVLLGATMVPLMPAQPAYACYGEICDGFCVTWDLANKVWTKLDDSCPVR